MTVYVTVGVGLPQKLLAAPGVSKSGESIKGGRRDRSAGVGISPREPSRAKPCRHIFYSMQDNAMRNKQKMTQSTTPESASLAKPGLRAKGRRPLKVRVGRGSKPRHQTHRDAGRSALIAAVSGNSLVNPWVANGCGSRMPPVDGRAS